MNTTITRDGVIKWVGSILIAISAVIIAFSPRLAVMWPSFIGYCIGALVWTYYGVKAKEWSLAVLNLFYLAIDIYAIYVRL